MLARASFLAPDALYKFGNFEISARNKFYRHKTAKQLLLSHFEIFDAMKCILSAKLTLALIGEGVVVMHPHEFF